MGRSIKFNYIPNLVKTHNLDLKPGRIFEYLIDKKRSEIVIGRTKEMHTHLNRPSVGKKVVKIYLAGENVHVEDLGSRGCSFLNDNRILWGQDRQLRDGDELEIGSLLFRIRIANIPKI